jgi:hypothetical protein
MVVIGDLENSLHLATSKNVSTASSVAVRAHRKNPSVEPQKRKNIRPGGAQQLNSRNRLARPSLIGTMSSMFVSLTVANTGIAYW